VLARPKFAFPPEEVKAVLAYCGTWLNPHALNLAKTHFVAAPVIEFRRFDVRVTCHPLGDPSSAKVHQSSHSMSSWFSRSDASSGIQWLAPSISS